MLATNFLILAASTIMGFAQASPSSPLEARQTVAPYFTYKGNGTPEQGWPVSDQWRSFDDLWNINIPRSPGACRFLQIGANSDSENAFMRASILKYASQSGLDARFILVAVQQESSMCVRVRTTVSPNAGARNPGLLQSANGVHTCNDVGAGVPLLNPCPEAQIDGMISDGVGFTTTWGLMQVVQRGGGAQFVSSYYRGAVLYNSGIMPASGNLGQGRSNPCYASDIANRLMGWAADSSPCDKATVGN
ncbi:hypothetical protein BDV98DRAFT_42485 [Pterulicium gracile]|uniref:Uncharacterized protein n=1 Tax=Pterulicium gracile TaxID=1884261 RepID=A0A5C3R0V7_9AGAR|nr:hypothetical protein BDV98DRAFT_42485 [Pterula gracilis]